MKKNYSFKRADYYAKVSAAVETMKYTFEYHDSLFIQTGVWAVTKTESFLAYCDDTGLDVDEILADVIEKGNIFDFGRNRLHPNCSILVFTYKDAAISDEALYCKVSLDEQDILHVDLHRTFSDENILLY